MTRSEGGRLPAPPWCCDKERRNSANEAFSLMTKRVTMRATVSIYIYGAVTNLARGRNDKNENTENLPKSTLNAFEPHLIE